MRAKAVSAKEAQSIFEKLLQRKTTLTLFSEAQRLGVYHATLRKALRELIGEKEFTRLLGRRVRSPTAGVQRRKPVTSVEHAPRRKNAADTSLTAKDDPTECRRCRGVRIPGTNGNGVALVVRSLRTGRGDRFPAGDVQREFNV